MALDSLNEKVENSEKVNNEMSNLQETTNSPFNESSVCRDSRAVFPGQEISLQRTYEEGTSPSSNKELALINNVAVKLSPGILPY